MQLISAVMIMMMNKYDLTTSENDGNNGIKAIKFNQYNLFI